MVPNDRKYTREHDWVLIEDGIAKLGITDHAQDALGDIVYVELPAVGDELALGDCYTTIESVKAASPVYTPVAGEVVEINEELDATPELLNQDAFENWIIKVQLSDASELDNLMDAAAYEEHCKNEE